MKTLNVIYLVSLTIWVTSCRFQGFSQPYETTVQVVDLDGKPIANRTVRLTTGTSSSDTTRIKKELLTNNEGKAVFNYDLSVSDSHIESARFFATDDNTWKGIAFEEHTLEASQSKTIKKEIQLTMDSLKPVKIRLSSNRNDLIRYSIRAYFSDRNLDILSRERRASSIDTTFTVKILSKYSSAISASTGYNSEPKTWNYLLLFTDKMNRDSTYWIQLL